MAAPLPGGRNRIVGVSPTGLTTSRPGDLTLEELRDHVIAVTGKDFGMRDPSWLSRFGNATRVAAHYRRGRRLLAGDATHQHFPAGGVGMNVGVQDASNLGRKLAATERGWGAQGLLDSYHTERHLVGGELAEGSRAQTALKTGFTPEGLDVRALFSGLMATQPALNHFLSQRLTRVSVTYPTAAPDAHSPTGTRAPDLNFTGSATSLFDQLHADASLLLDLTGEADGALSLSRRRACRCTAPRSRHRPRPGRRRAPHLYVPAATSSGRRRAPTTRP